MSYNLTPPLQSLLTPATFSLAPLLSPDTPKLPMPLGSRSYSDTSYVPFDSSPQRAAKRVVRLLRILGPLHVVGLTQPLLVPLNSLLPGPGNVEVIRQKLRDSPCPPGARLALELALGPSPFRDAGGSVDPLVPLPFPETEAPPPETPEAPPFPPPPASPGPLPHRPRLRSRSRERRRSLGSIGGVEVGRRNLVYSYNRPVRKRSTSGAPGRRRKGSKDPRRAAGSRSGSLGRARTGVGRPRDRSASEPTAVVGGRRRQHSVPFLPHYDDIPLDKVPPSYRERLHRTDLVSFDPRYSYPVIRVNKQLVASDVHLKQTITKLSEMNLIPTDVRLDEVRKVDDRKFTQVLPELIDREDRRRARRRQREDMETAVYLSLIEAYALLGNASQVPSRAHSEPHSRVLSQPPSQPQSRGPSQPLSRPSSRPSSRPLSRPLSRPQSQTHSPAPSPRVASEPTFDSIDEVAGREPEVAGREPELPSNNPFRNYLGFRYHT